MPTLKNVNCVTMGIPSGWQKQYGTQIVEKLELKVNKIKTGPVRGFQTMFQLPSCF